MTTLTLYEIADARDILDSWLLESEGEVTPELEALLSEIDAKADEKIERVALFVREQRALALAAKEERDRIGAVVKRRENAAASLTLYLQREMERLGKSKVTGLLCTVAIQNNPPSVKGEPVMALDELYALRPELVRCVPASYALDRKAALDASKAGAALPMGVTVEQSQSIRIR